MASLFSRWKLKRFLEEDQSVFFEIVADLFSDDIGVRGPADSLFHAAMEEYTDVIAVRLLSAIQRSRGKQRRLRCFTLLSRFLGGKWPKIHPRFQDRCKRFLIELIQREGEWDVIKVECECLASVAWPELVDIICKWVSPNNKALTKPAADGLLPLLKMNNEPMRHLIVRLFITVGEGGDQNCKMIRTIPSYAIGELFTQCVIWVEVEGDISLEVPEMNVPCHDEHTLRRLAMVLGQDLVVSCLANLLLNYFNDNDWKQRYAGVISLGLIAPSLIPSKVLVRNLEQYVKETMELIHDQDPRVCCAALYTFCEFSKLLKPYFQEECHDVVINALSKAMDDSVNPRVQTYAALAMSTFCQNGCSDIFKPYLGEMITKLLLLLGTSGKTNEAALSGLASVADSAKDDFLPFCDVVILKLNNLRSKEISSRLLVAKILHCITVVALAVGKSVVGVEEALAELCRQYSSEDNFHPYLHAFMLPLIKAAKLEDRYKWIASNKTLP